MPIGGEKAGVQNPAVRYSTEAGWSYLIPEDALDLRRDITSPTLDSVFIDQLQRLNPRIVDHQRAEQLRDRLIRVRPNIEGNLTAWEYLKGLKTVFVEAEKREVNVRLLDPEHLDANTFHVTDEFTFSNGTGPDIRADIVFFVNGVPVIICETKAATHTEGIAEAFGDIRYYHKEGPEFVAITQLHALTHVIQFYYGATWNLSRKGLFNWRDEAAGSFEDLIKTFVAPRRVLRAITEFILFVRKDGELTKAVLRPHQMRGVDKCVARAAEAKRRGLIWHTQGSGKTYTMITVARQLMEDQTFQNPTILMLIDRNELEGQLSGNLEAVGFVPPDRPSSGKYTYYLATSKKHLRDLLTADRRGLIVSMIHKFDDIPANVCTRDNVFVLVDEAHRTTGGDLGNYLMGALPRATYLGFTGTPIDKTAYGKGTFKVFGVDDEKGYLDKYSIRESVEDGTTVPLHYSLAPNELLVDRGTLEREFLDLKELEGVSDIEEVNKVLERAVTLRNMLKNRDRVEKVARFIADHYQTTVEPMGYKAFVVAVDREACALYKKALDRHLPVSYSEVVISSAGKKDTELLRQYWLEESKEREIRKRFRHPDEEPKLLIVTEKLLTGFDAPILYCMYLDKPMRDHVLLQAIARVNRPYEDEERRKPAGFVLDFVGIFDKLEKALAFDSDDIKDVVTGIDILKEQFERMMAVVRETYLPITADQSGDKAIEAVLDHFRDKEARDQFYQFYRELEEVYEILSPDAFLRPFVEDYQGFASLYRVVRSGYERSIPVDKSFLRKTAQLVQQHSHIGVIDHPSETYKLTSETLEILAEEDKPDTVKVFNLLKALEALVRRSAQDEPYLIGIGERAQVIAEAFENRQKTTQEALEELDRLIAELRDAERQRDETELTPEAFAVYWLLKREGIEQAPAVARAAAEAFEQHPHWHSSSRHEREVRKALYKALIDAKMEDVVEVATSIMRTLRRAR
jgi:type I restriction enzyme R subunit